MIFQRIPPYSPEQQLSLAAYHCAADCHRLLVPKAGDLEGMRQYVEAGGSVKKRDFFNNTALHRSASMGFTVITGYLLESGAEVDAVASDGW